MPSRPAPLRSLQLPLTAQLGAAGRLGLAAGQALAGRLGHDPGADRAFGRALAAELDPLKGMAMKIGQILSTLDVLPPAAAAELAHLQRGAVPYDPALLRPWLESSLGLPLEQAFERFDEEPVAAASIGQVHRARLGGVEVAVKVQYPGVRERLEQDLGRLRRVGQLAALGAPVDGPALVAELRARVLAECDYRAEARAQAAFGRAWAGTPGLRVPRVVPERSAEGVLCTEWAEGVGFEEAVARLEPAARRAAAEAWIRFSWGGLLQHGALQADPHPGNARFAPDGVVFLDFGCAVRFGAPTVEALRALSRVVVQGRRADFEGALRATGAVARGARFDFDHHWAHLRALYAPFIAPRFTYTPGWLRPAMEAMGPRSPNARALDLPPEWLWIHRMQWGLGAVLGRLGAEGDFATLFRGILDTPLVPLEW